MVRLETELALTAHVDSVATTRTATGPAGQLADVLLHVTLTVDPDTALSMDAFRECKGAHTCCLWFGFQKVTPRRAL